MHENVAVLGPWCPCFHGLTPVPSYLEQSHIVATQTIKEDVMMFIIMTVVAHIDDFGRLNVRQELRF
jgi:hypothetical protein